MSNYINLNEDKYTYLCEYNQVINTQVKDHFLEFADEDRRVSIEENIIDEELLKEKLKSVHQLILEISEGCNMRCKYCVYDGNYINERRLAENLMEYDLAVKAIDYIYSLIKDRSRKHFSIGFYGGEPMLNFKTIEKIVPYTLKKFDGWSLDFNMTTNMTLLTGNILEFFIKHNFSLLVSLDGNKANHDAKRVFANGQGTFDIVMKNLKKIQDRDQDYFKERVSFSAVHSYDLSMLDFYNFFSQHPQFHDQRMRFSGVRTYDTDYFERNPIDRDRLKHEHKKIFNTIFEKAADGIELSSIETFILSNLNDIGDRLNNRNFDILFGTCLFDSRVYVDTSGNFHVCEKMNNRFPIGNVDQGFDYKRMVDMTKQYIALIKEHCLSCNLRFLCSRCFVNFCGDGVFEMNPEFCQNKKVSVMKSLEKYIHCKERKLI